MLNLPPLGLSVDVVRPDGTRKRWDSNAPASDRPQGLSFRTRSGDGFSDGQATLSRRIDTDYDDLTLLNDVEFVGDDGSTAYEGRIAAIPRSMADTHSVSVQTAGHMAHARDRKATFIGVDRDLGNWRGASTGRKAGAASTFDVDDSSTAPDVTDGRPGLVLGFQGPWARTHVAEGWYDAGPGMTVGAVYYSLLQNASVSLADANWSASLFSSPTDGTTASFTNETGDLMTGTGAFLANNTYETLTTAQRFVLWQLGYTGAAGTAGQNYEVYVRDLAVYGNNPGLSGSGSNPVGLLASDVIKYIAQTYCPKLNTAGVQATTYPIPHLVQRDVDPYDIFLEVNKYHLWDIGVWENKTLTYQQYDLSDYDWEVRLSDLGTTVDLQGDASDDLFNGIDVVFTDVATGTTGRVTPNDDPTLADTDPNNPVNANGYTRWLPLPLTTPTTAAAAVQIGRIALAEANLPKAPGTIRITGHIRDRAGHWQQGWRVRAGDTVAITDHPNDRPRVITETDWNHDAKQLTLSVEGPAHRMDALMDRITTALTAANLS